MTRISSQDGPFHGKRVVLGAAAFGRLHEYAMERHYADPREARSDGYADALAALLDEVEDSDN